MAIDTYDHKSFCANCQKSGTAVCSHCRLVAYCSKDCQIEHRKTHEGDCKSLLRAESWQPRWAIENREPTWLGTPDRKEKPVPQVTDDTDDRHLWGNMPALDVLQLQSNEGESFSEDMSLLFAACGDLRNVVKTLAALPQSYDGKLTVVINDHDPQVIARNVIMCILAASVDDADQVSECITHIWYCALIRQADLDLLNAHVLPLIEEVCSDIKDQASTSLHSKTWRVRKCSLCITMSKEAWQLLLSCLTVRPELSIQQAQALRLAVMNGKEDQDIRDRLAVPRSPAHRVSKSKVNEDGIILPFGYSRKAFVIPNPTLYQAGNWPLEWTQDPIRGWGLAQVMRTPCGNTTNDLTGKLYCHIRTHLKCFHRYLAEKGASFDFFSMDAAQLPNVLPDSTFARIEVSNVCDVHYLGPEQTLSTLGPLLQKSSVNPHATLLALFKTAVGEAQSSQPRSITAQKEFDRIAANRVCQYKSILKLLKSEAVFDPMLSAAVRYVWDHQSLFERYCKRFKFSELAVKNRLRIKAKHSIVEKWPLALKLQKGDAGFDDEFAILFASGHYGGETYVEWTSVE